ncbi:MAG: DEAD/DEAH box helicase [Phormidium sp. BM_Day4_Bin.17]|nr:DEAD/DEAH box helicase [Phormidium sp. BM_Day4_Bin.17]UCJ11276.1 MAG: DEAD/DEAH box helicase [Phormidium sp. PBR-2020]
MAVLHGSWLLDDNSFFLWGETWRRLLPDAIASGEDIAEHPFALNPDDLHQYLHQQQLNLPSDCPPQVQQLQLPSQKDDSGLRPLYSAGPGLDEATLSLHPWQVPGLQLSPPQALELLRQLPLTVAEAGSGSQERWLGPDLRLWQHLSRWSLDLLARGKFVPGFVLRADGRLEARWQLLLDSPRDSDRLYRFSQRLPDACRAIAPESNSATARDNLPSPQALIRGFLSAIVDCQVRQMHPNPGDTPVPPLLKEWFTGLTSSQPHLNLSLKQAEPLASTLNAWLAPVESALLGQNQFRTALRLDPPQQEGDSWSLEFLLQAVYDPSFTVPAATIWTHPVDRLSLGGHTINRPQETLLSGLGLASRLYPTLEGSLETSRPQRCSLNAIEAYEFLKSVRWRLQETGLGVILPPSLESLDGPSGRMGLQVRAEAPKPGQSLGLQGLLNFQWELSLGGKTISKAEFEHLTTQGSPLVEVDGEWVELRVADVRAAQEFFSNRQGDLALSLEDALRISMGDTQTLGKLPVVQFETSGVMQELMDTLTGKRHLEPLAAPPSFAGELRPYQARGVGWLAFLERWGLGACLADDMGLGKTIQTIAFLQHLQEQSALNGPVLLVCPTSVLGNWEREVKKFGPSLSVLVHHGAKRAKGKDLRQVAKNQDLLITSYALVYRDIKALQGIDWRIVVLDEAQNVKNHQAKQSQAVRQLASDFRIALTGTPVENRLSELWSILDFLNPGYLGSPSFFKRRFAIPIERYGDTDSLKTLRSLVQPFILRRLKTDKDIIQDLPEKQEMTEFCPLSPRQAKRYQELVQASLVEIESAQGIQRRGLILGLLTQLKQVCNHPQLLGLKNKKSKAEILKRMSQDSGKVQRLEELLDELIAEGDRALIFTQFAEWGKVLKTHLEQRLGGEVFFLYGATRKAQREEMVERFQDDPQGPRIFILSLKAGGTGLNLTRANHVFHVDRWWNPAVENQATDRVFRIGQTRNVQVHKFVSQGTLEEKIHDLIESKQALAEQVVSSGESWLADLDTDHLRNLLLLDRTAIVEDE